MTVDSWRRRPSETRVSIVTPSRNQGRFLEATMESVLGQTYPKVEYVVIDGGSTDESVDIIRAREARLAHWRSEPDEGFADAIDKGFRRTTGSVLAYLNSDDLLAPTAVEEAVRFLDDHPDVVMVHGNRICIDERGHLLYVRAGIPFGTRHPHVCTFLAQETCFFRRDAYDRVGGVAVRRRFAVDYDLFSRISRVGRIAHCPRVWGYFRKHGASKTMTSYATLGRTEVADVLREVWGGERTAAEAALVATTCRAYAVAHGAIIESARWPAGVPKPRPASLRERVAHGLRPDHPLRRGLAWLDARGSTG